MLRERRGAAQGEEAGSTLHPEPSTLNPAPYTLHPVGAAGAPFWAPRTLLQESRDCPRSQQGMSVLQGFLREGTGDRLWWDWIKPQGPKA